MFDLTSGVRDQMSVTNTALQSLLPHNWQRGDMYQSNFYIIFLHVFCPFSRLYFEEIKCLEYKRRILLRHFKISWIQSCYMEEESWK